MSKPVIPGLKLIKYNVGHLDLPDDPSFPYKLEISLRPLERDEAMLIFLYDGTEEIVVRSTTKEALDQFIEANDLRNHPRLRHLIITGPDGSILEEFPLPVIGWFQNGGSK